MLNISAKFRVTSPLSFDIEKEFSTYGLNNNREELTMPPPVAVSKIIKFDPNSGTIKVEIRFTTLLLCAYTIMLRETGSNATLKEFKGDNTNPADDIYSLPDPASSNDGRVVWAVVTVVDQSGQGGDYVVDLAFTQDNKSLGVLTTGKKSIQGTSVTEVLVAKLTV